VAEQVARAGRVGEVRELAERGARDLAVEQRLRHVPLEPALWTFVHTPGVEPTNNAAERILRQGVLWRKGSLGTDSPKGSRFVERILTAVTTLRLQKRKVLDSMTAACEAALHGTSLPSLLPT
jgi:transposase